MQLFHGVNAEIIIDSCIFCPPLSYVWDFEKLSNLVLFRLNQSYICVCVCACVRTRASLSDWLSLFVSVCLSLAEKLSHMYIYTHSPSSSHIHTYTQSSLCQTTQSHTSHERYALFPPKSHLVITRSSAGPYTTPPVTLYFHTFISCKCSILSLCFPWTRHFPHWFF